MDAREALIREIDREFAETAELTGRGAMSPRVRAALAAVAREAFVGEGWKALAYENRPLPIGNGQTISQPFIVAVMTELLDLSPEDRVLEVGTGSGYQAAVLSRLAARVLSLEVIPALAERAVRALAGAGCDNVEVHVCDGARGWPEGAPYDAIMVTAATPRVPAALIAQLRAGGRMVLPLGEPWGDQELTLLTKGADGGTTERRLLPVAFVPLTRG